MAKHPPCGLADCDRPATHVDSYGVGYCETHGAEEGLPRVSRRRPFDPWWAAATSDPEAFKGLDYGTWPRDPGEVGGDRDPP